MAVYMHFSCWREVRRCDPRTNDGTSEWYCDIRTLRQLDMLDIFEMLREWILWNRDLCVWLRTVLSADSDKSMIVHGQHDWWRHAWLTTVMMTLVLIISRHHRFIAYLLCGDFVSGLAWIAIWIMCMTCVYACHRGTKQGNTSILVYTVIAAIIYYSINHSIQQV
jgi:hypothetical protein